MTKAPAKKRTFTKGNARQYTMLFALVVLVIMFQLFTGGKLLRPMNVANLVFQNAYVVILSVGMLICIIGSASIDLSVGSVVAFVGACAGQMIIVNGMNVYLGIAICVLISIAIGIWQGFWIAYVRIPAFIVTLSSMLVFRGLTLLILNGLTLSPFPSEYLQYSTGYIPNMVEEFIFMGSKLNLTAVVVGILAVVAFWATTLFSYNQKVRKGYETENPVFMFVKLIVVSAVVLYFFYILAKFRGIPTVLVILSLILLIYSYFMSNVVMGRRIYAMGGNEKAARMSGIKTNKLLFLSYVNMGFLSGVAGLVFAARLNSASPQAGQGFELDAIGACYIGGASAYGGVGTVGGTLVGALIMGILNNGMSIMGINSNLQQVVKGLVLLAAVAFDVISKMQINWFWKRSKTSVKA